MADNATVPGAGSGNVLSVPELRLDPLPKKLTDIVPEMATWLDRQNVKLDQFRRRWQTVLDQLRT
mgnify:CR=1 FL=1